MLRFSLCAPIACSLILTACGTTLALSSDELGRGAQQGWILGFYSAETNRSDLPACLAALSPEELATHRFARVQYHHGRAMPIVPAELPAALSAEAGDTVAMWMQPCSETTHSVIFKVAHPSGSR